MNTMSWYNKIFRFFRTNSLHLTKVIVIVVLFVIGGFLLLTGMSQHGQVIYESSATTSGIVILGDNDTVIENMKIVVSAPLASHVEHGWMGTIIDFNSTCPEMNLAISLPFETDFWSFSNVSKTSFFHTESYYNSSTDSSFLFVSYVSLENNTRIRIDFDWKILQKASYDQERVRIIFSNPYYGKPLFQELLSVYGLNWIPEIDQLTVQVQAFNSVDFSDSVPQPSYYYVIDGESSIFWTFDNNREVSSIQAVFKNSTLSRSKFDLTFQSGLLIAFGTSTLLWAVKEVAEFAKDSAKAFQERKRMATSIKDSSF